MDYLLHWPRSDQTPLISCPVQATSYTADCYPRIVLSTADFIIRLIIGAPRPPFDYRNWFLLRLFSADASRAFRPVAAFLLIRCFFHEPTPWNFGSIQLAVETRLSGSLSDLLKYKSYHMLFYFPFLINIKTPHFGFMAYGKALRAKFERNELLAKMCEFRKKKHHQ